MFNHYPIWAMPKAGEKALEAISGIGINLLTNTPERCWDRTHHKDVCVHEKDDTPCKKCVSCDPKRLVKSDVFWYTSRSFTKRYKQEKAKVGDVFYDGNNGDKHLVAAVDLENSRLAYSNLDQCEELLHIACW